MSVNSMVLTAGDLHLPVVAADFTTTATPLDPGRAKLAALFKAAINDELGEVWTKLTAGLTAGHPFYGTTPVEDVLELEPTPKVMQERRPAWPLLCIHRTGTAQWSEHTLEIDKVVQPWALHYILGPLDIAGLRQFGDICVAVAKIVMAVIRRRGHASYESGALQFFPGKGGFASITMTSTEGPGQASFAGDEHRTVYYAMTLHLETMETNVDLAGEAGDFDAVDFDVSVGNDAESVPSLIQAASDQTGPLSG